MRSANWILYALLAAAALTYLPATACKNSSHESRAAAACEAAVGGDTAAVVTGETKDADDHSALDSLKSKLRAGKAVGRALVTTTVVVASSMARAARLAAAALVVTAYSLF